MSDYGFGRAPIDMIGTGSYLRIIGVKPMQLRISLTMMAHQSKDRKRISLIKIEDHARYCSFNSTSKKSVQVILGTSLKNGVTSLTDDVRVWVTNCGRADQLCAVVIFGGPMSANDCWMPGIKKSWILFPRV